MGCTTQIHFVRHGHVHNPDEVFYGRLPGFALSECGHQQAEAAAMVLRERALRAVFSSPMQRAQETASHIVRFHEGPVVQTSDLLQETNAPYEGLLLSEMAERSWDIYSGNEAPFEQPPDILLRMLRFVEQVLRNYPGSEIAAVTHGDPLAFLLLWARGSPIEGPARLPLYREFLAKGSISTFTFGSDSRLTTDVQYCLPYPPEEQAPSGIAKWLEGRRECAKPTKGDECRNGERCCS